MHITKQKTYIILLCFFLISIFAQSRVNPSGKHKTDSLLSALKLSKIDSNKVKILHSLGNVYYDEGNYDSALFYQLQCLELNEKSNSISGIIKCNNDIGNIYKRLGDINKALLHFEKALVL